MNSPVVKVPASCAVTGCAPGDTVSRIKLADPLGRNGGHELMSMTGIVQAVWPYNGAKNAKTGLGPGGIRNYVSVQWESGLTIRCEDRNLALRPK